LDSAAAREEVQRLAEVSSGGATLLPDEIGRYRIRRQLGEGGMSVVYLAEQDNPRRTVALKVVRAGALSEALIRRFQHEADILGHLQHPGIAQIYEAGTERTSYGLQPFFAMEYVDGLRLDEFVRHRKLDPRQCVELMARICDAVHYAHQKGVIHRDLKPANILIVAGSRIEHRTHPAPVVDSAQPKILDFGVARVTDADLRTATMHTRTGQIVGTVPYMSPEQVGGRTSELDTRSDVYALGVILFELLSGRLPLDVRERGLAEALRMIRDSEPPGLGSVDPRLRGDLESIAARALEKSPERRYASAAEMAADLRRYLRHEPIVARPQTTLYQWRKFAERNPTLVVSIAVVMVTLVAGLVASLTFAARERDQRQRAEKLARREHEHRQLAEQFVHGILARFTEILELEGATRAREYLTQLTGGYVDRLLAMEGDWEPSLLMDLGLANAAIADAKGRPQAASRGDPAGALAHYRKAKDIYQLLSERDPGNVDARRNLAISHERIGNLQLAQGLLDEAQTSYRLSHSIKLTLVDIDPRGQENLSFSYSKLGDIDLAQGRPESALEMYGQSLDIRRELLRREPAEARWQRAVSMALNRVGDALVELGRPAEALQRYQEVLNLRLARAADQPESSAAQLDLAVSLHKVGEGLEGLDRFSEALAQYERARAILGQLAAADPTDASSAANLAEVDFGIARMRARAGRLDEARALLDSTLAAFEPAAGGSDVAQLRELLAMGYRSSAEVDLQRGEPGPAFEAYGRWLDIREALSAASPDYPAYRRELADARCTVAAARRQRATAPDVQPAERAPHWSAARDLLLRALADFTTLQEQGALPPTHAGTIDLVRGDLAECERALERGAEASSD
jgi:tetratricopeptide (TPR) repeat protein/predicted Ser/Thr protein kinase